jgi:hypothetical protein
MERRPRAFIVSPGHLFLLLNDNLLLRKFNFFTVALPSHPAPAVLPRHKTPKAGPGLSWRQLSVEQVLK